MHGMGTMGCLAVYPVLFVFIPDYRYVNFFKFLGGKEFDRSLRHEFEVAEFIGA